MGDDWLQKKTWNQSCTPSPMGIWNKPRRKDD